MPRQLWQASIALGLLLLLRQASAVESSVVYGSDNRLNYYQEHDEKTRTLSDSTVALIRSVNVTQSGDTTTLVTEPYGQGLGLCSDEPFYSEETAAYCSGFLVAPDIVVTAGHCLPNIAACTSTKFVFNFRIESEGQMPRVLPSDQVYDCKELIYTIREPQGEDFAIARLNREVNGHKSLSYRTEGKPEIGAPLTVMGYPAGLPLKIAGGAAVRSVQDRFLVANTDTYGGNSGSAVFSDVTGKVEGILVRGDADYVLKNGCRVSNQCPDNGCRGEDVTLFERVLPHLPKSTPAHR